MKISQKRAIWYSIRDARLEKIEKSGLMPAFIEYNKGKKYNCITSFYKKMNLSEK